jgi:hypothetical protein
MPEAEVECGDAKVAELLAFVDARAQEDRLGGQLTTPVDEPLLDRCDIVQNVLLDMARDTCRASEPCGLPQRCLCALGEYAFMHKAHKDYDPGWAVWRLLT